MISNKNLNFDRSTPKWYRGTLMSAYEAGLRVPRPSSLKMRAGLSEQISTQAVTADRWALTLSLICLYVWPEFRSARNLYDLVQVGNVS